MWGITGTSSPKLNFQFIILLYHGLYYQSSYFLQLHDAWQPLCKSVNNISLSQSNFQSKLTRDARMVAHSCSSSISAMSSIFRAIRALPSLIWGLIGRLRFSFANQRHLIAARVAQIDLFHLFCNENSWYFITCILHIWSTYLCSPSPFPPLSLFGFPFELLELLSDLLPVGGLRLLPRDPGDGDLGDRVVPLHHRTAATTFPRLCNPLFPHRWGRTPRAAQGDILGGAEVEKSCWSGLVPAGLLGDHRHRHAYPHLLRGALGHRHLEEGDIYEVSDIVHT